MHARRIVKKVVHLNGIPVSDTPEASHAELHTDALVDQVVFQLDASVYAL